MADSAGGDRPVFSGAFTSSAAYVELEGHRPPFSVSVYPGAGCTCTVEICNKPGAASNPPANSDWEALDLGAVTAAKTDWLNAPVGAVRFKRTAGSASCEYAVRGC